HAIESHFIVESNEGHSLRFNHALVREVIYLKIVLPERQHLHRLAGEALLAHPAPDVDLVAFHLARAMDARAIDWLALAGEHALSVSAPMVAIEACDRALVVARSLSRTAPSSIHRTRGTAYAIVGEFLRARQDFTHVLDRARQDGDRLTEWQALQDLGQLWSSRDYSRTQELFNEALELARQIQDEQLIAHSLSSVGTWYLNDGQPVTAIRFHEDALASFREAGDELAIAQTNDLLGMDYIILGDLVTAERVLRDAISAFELMGEHVALCSAF